MIAGVCVRDYDEGVSAIRKGKAIKQSKERTLKGSRLNLSPRSSKKKSVSVPVICHVKLDHNIELFCLCKTQ